MKPRSLIARSTLRFVGSLTVSGRLSTFETVPTDTPARLATSLTPVVADLTRAFRARPMAQRRTVALKGFSGLGGRTTGTADTASGFASLRCERADHDADQLQPSSVLDERRLPNLLQSLMRSG